MSLAGENSVSIVFASDADPTPIATPEHDDSSFALAVWAGTIGGTTLGLDPNPNVTPPAESRILHWTTKSDALPGGSALLRVVLGDGTSASFQPWIFDTTQNQWIHWGLAQNLTAAANLQGGGQFSGNINGARLFMQITANVGMAAFGYDVR